MFVSSLPIMVSLLLWEWNPGRVLSWVAAPARGFVGALQVPGGGSPGVLQVLAIEGPDQAATLVRCSP